MVNWLCHLRGYNKSKNSFYNIAIDCIIIYLNIKNNKAPGIAGGFFH